MLTPLNRVSIRRRYYLGSLLMVFLVALALIGWVKTRHDSIRPLQWEIGTDAPDERLRLVARQRRPSWDQAIELMRGSAVVHIYTPDLTGIERLRSVKVDIVLTPRGVAPADLAILGSLPNLTELELDDTDIADLSILPPLTSLRSINLSQTKVRDLSPLRSLKKLRVVNLSFAQGVADFSPLSMLENLTELHASDTGVRDLSPLANLKKLRKLDLSGTQISDLSALGNLKELEWLNVYDTQVSDLGPLSHLIKLATLDIRSTKITNVFPLQSIHSLRYVDMEGLEGVKGVSELKRTDLQIVEP